VGLFGKAENAPSTPPSPPRERREPVALSSSEAPTVIGKDTIIKGELSSSTDMLIEGRVEGQVHGAKRVIVGESGDVEARVEAQVVTVRGTVRGDCEASKKVEITATGKVFGNIAAHAIVVAEGATFRGASKMSQPESPKPAPAKSSEPAGGVPAGPPAPSSAT
jgi:cytoskeletal protein CcmA (bactofilin family)